MHFQLTQEIGKLEFKRATVPNDDVIFDFNKIDTAHAIKQVACVTIYTRFLRKYSKYSCQLLFSTSKVIPDGLS